METMRCCLAMWVVLSGFIAAQGSPVTDPANAGMSTVVLGQIPGAIERAMERKEVPGAVVLVGRGPRVVFRAAVGGPDLAVDSVFDLASLTKPVATATTIMKLVQAGKLKLSDRVQTHLPGFTGHGKDEVTVDQLLRHRGGLLPDNALADYQKGKETSRERINALDLRSSPGSKFIYTDVGFIVLGWVVEQVTGRPLNEVAKSEIFDPLGMNCTGFLPTARPGSPLDARCVPTEPAEKGGSPLRGVVHDPRSRLLGGVSGHAGLFSTADDLALYAASLLASLSGSAEGLLAPELARAMVDAGDLPAGQRRGLGWDVDTRYSSPRGAFPRGSFGHTGFTGTSLWIDPATETFVVILTSRLFPKGGGNARRLREEVATLVAQSVRDAPWPVENPALTNATVITGLERLALGDWPPELRGKRVGLITNHTGLTRFGVHGKDLLARFPHLRLVALFSPEHGIHGTLDAKVQDAVDKETGLPVFSLYGENRGPTEASLESIDVLVFDIQDIGTRFYTYISTMVNCMKEAARKDIPFVVLDRPNPIGGDRVAGPVADSDQLDFVGCLRIPVRHGLTVGELALFARKELALDLNLRVIQLLGWRRELLFHLTDSTWINPSPNMRSFQAAILYPGIGLLETTNISVGRGTKTPFELLGAPWLDGERLCSHLQGIPGINVSSARFTPDASKFKDEVCSGIRMTVTDPRRFESLDFGMRVATLLRSLHADAWSMDAYPRLLKHKRTFDAIKGGLDWQAVTKGWEPDLKDFMVRRQEHLLYDR